MVFRISSKTTVLQFLLFIPVIHSFIHVSVESVGEQLFIEHSLCLMDQTGAKDSTQN